MGLSDPLGMVRRRWPVVAIVTLLFLMVAAGLAIRTPRGYNATIDLAVSVGDTAPANPPPYAYYQDYYTWLSSEYLADDLSQLVLSDAFSREIAAYIKGPFDKSAIVDTVRARGTHSILEVIVHDSAPGRAEQVAEVVPVVIRSAGSKYLTELAPDHGQVTLLAAPLVEQSVTRTKLLVDVAVRGGFGLLVGLFLALTIEYLDTTLRSAAAVQRDLGLPILGEIPA